MKLTDIQIQIVTDHIKTITTYAETYNEVADHVISELSSEPHSFFSRELVDLIIEEDFGGTRRIRLEEEKHKEDLRSGLIRKVWMEMSNSFKFPGIITSLIFLGFFYVVFAEVMVRNPESQIFPTVLIILMFCPLLFYVAKVYILERAWQKPSIKNPALLSASFMGMNFATFILCGFLLPDPPLIDISPGTKIILMLGSYFLLSVYVRAYLKIYNNTLQLKLT